MHWYFWTTLPDRKLFNFIECLLFGIYHVSYCHSICSDGILSYLRLIESWHRVNSLKIDSHRPLIVPLIRQKSSQV